MWTEPEETYRVLFMTTEAVATPLHMSRNWTRALKADPLRVGRRQIVWSAQINNDQLQQPSNTYNNLIIIYQGHFSIAFTIQLAKKIFYLDELKFQK